MRQQATVCDNQPMLTPNQIKAAELLSQGASHQEVADAVGVSRRTILRWLNSGEFKNWQYALVNRPRPAEKVPKPPPSKIKTDSLQPSDLVQDALETVRDILCDPDTTRVSDRLKAAGLIGEWAGLAHQKPKMAEVEAIRALIEAGWLSEQTLDALKEGSDLFKEKMRSAFAQNEPKKALLQDKFDDE